MAGKDSPTLSDVYCTNVNLSDHFLITFKAAVGFLSNDVKSIIFRNLMSIDTDSFCTEAATLLKSNDNTDFGEKISFYNKTLRQLVDKYAPLEKKRIVIKPKSPWFDSEYQNLRRKRRLAEKKYRRTQSEKDKADFIKPRKDTTSLAFKKKKKYYSNKISSCSTTKSLFECVNKLVDNTKSTALPSHTSSTDLANRFNAFFKKKIADIRNSFPKNNTNNSSTPSFNGEVLSIFRPSTEEEIRSIVTTFKIKCSPEDPVPAKILSNCLDFFIPIWLELVNLSLEQGSIDCLKSAVVLPLQISSL